MPVFAHEIQEEQGDIQPKHIVVGVTGGSHHLAPPPLIFADTDQPRLNRPALLEHVLVAGSWMIPRLPVNRPLCGIATISPNGVTGFAKAWF
jgi:hypothetical protein